MKVYGNREKKLVEQVGMKKLWGVGMLDQHRIGAVKAILENLPRHAVNNSEVTRTRFET
ncbi:hypothetical protein [Bacillus wiedmannii]|uniref:hypothetical protein n=1 Tax=Bacillus wiedmannii TaxID=1890302 RepID=UPI00211D93AD|nr:hypothetical protein [Bacillus wiedmannii]